MTRPIGRGAFAWGLAVLVAFLGAFFLPGVADAQPSPPSRHIGVLLNAFSPEEQAPQAFPQGLRDAGYTVGGDVVIEWRAAHRDRSRLPALAADLVQRKVDVIVVDSTPGAQAAKNATSTIPIVLALVVDPVGSGLVASLQRPGGNVTGLSMMTPELAGKRLQLLKEAIPSLARVGVLRNPDFAFHTQVVKDLRAAAPSLSIELSFADARTPEEFGPALSVVSRARAQALYVIEDSLFLKNRTTLLKLASQARLPVTYGERHFAEDGGLVSYGPNFGDLFYRSAGYVNKILKGAKPRDLPIEQPTTFELVVNSKTARALGLTIPPSMLQRADQVIE
jgi:putative ABC transport system substrate-binding protein